MSQYKVGDRVWLTNKVGYIPTDLFPVRGSSLQSIGTITKIVRNIPYGNDEYSVRWDNGEDVITFVESHLEPAGPVYMCHLPEELFEL